MSGIYTTVVGVILGIASWHTLKYILKALRKAYNNLLDSYFDYLDDLALNKKEHKKGEVIASCVAKLKKEPELLDMLNELSRFPSLSIRQNQKSASGRIYEAMFRKMQNKLRRLLTSQEMLYYNSILELITREAMRINKDKKGD